jgi:hypothetical protein
MAERKFLFIQDDGFHEEQSTSDTITLGGLTMGGDIDMNSAGKIVNVNAATTDGDVIVFGQTGANLDDMTIASGGDITLSGGGEVVGLPATPSGDTAAASKAYVDATAQGLDVHESVRVATTGPVTLVTDFEAGDAIDGVTLVAGDRILIKNQSAGAENGIYVIQASGAPARAVDWEAGYEAAGAFAFVEEGTVNADSGWVCTNNNSADTTGTDALTFSQFSGAGQIAAGDGMTKSGNTLDVGAGNGISVAADTVAVAPDTASTSTLTANSIVVGSNGVSVRVDDDTIEGSLQGTAGAESLRLKDGGITGAKLDSAITINTTGTISAASLTTTGNITTSGGIFTGDGSGLTNLPSAASTDAVTVTAKKSTAGTINVGQVVHLVGFSSPDYTVELADADNPALMPAIGIATTTITDSAAGTVIVSGRATGIDTSAYSAGDSLYVSTTPGAITSTKPTGTALIQRIGEVASSAVSGIIQFTGAGRSNDVPNIPNGELWIGNASGVATPTPLGDGLETTPGTEVQVKITPDVGLHFNSGALEIELDNSPDTLDADSNGLKVVGLPAQFKINDVNVGSLVTAANLDTLVDGSNADSLHDHAHSALSNITANDHHNQVHGLTSSDHTESGLVAGQVLTALTSTTFGWVDNNADQAAEVVGTWDSASTLALGDPVYHDSTNDQIDKAEAGTNSKAWVVGIAKNTGTSSVDVVSSGIAAGVLSGATAGDRYWLAPTGGLVNTRPGSGNRLVLCGVAINATDLQVMIHDFGRKA